MKCIKETCHTVAIRHWDIKWQDTISALEKVLFRPIKKRFSQTCGEKHSLKKGLFSQDMRAAGPRIEGWVICLSKQRFITENSDNRQCEQCRQAPLTIHSIFETCWGFLERAKNKWRNAAIYTHTHIYYCSINNRWSCQQCKHRWL